jgi:PAS domain S-box-containing protein
MGLCNFRRLNAATQRATVLFWKVLDKKPAVRVLALGVSLMEPVRRNVDLLLGAFLMGALGVVAVGYLHYRNQRSAIEVDARNQLAAVGQLKVDQVAAWRKERLGDGQVLAAMAMAPKVRQVLEGRANAAARQQTLTWMNVIRETHGYANVILVNPRKKVWIVSGIRSNTPEHYFALATQVMQSGAVAFWDIHEDAGIPGPHLGLIVPLRSDVTGPPEGAILLGIDPHVFLYPLIQSWPTPSRTAETLLARKDGNDVVYLNELRHRKDTALKLRFPLSASNLPAARGVAGFEGILEGVDYRGVPVLAAVRRVPGSPWVLVAKIDVEEIYAPVREQTLWLGLIVASVMLGIGSGVAFLARDLRMRFYLQKHEADVERRALRGHYDYLSRFANDIIVLADDAARIMEVNDRATTAYGYTREELIGVSIKNLRAASGADAFDVQWRALKEQESIIFETVHRRKDASTFPVEVSARRIVVEGVAFRQSIIRDITERKHAEEERAKLRDQLELAHKLESVGRLAGGVAHDFNNLLTVINGYGGMLLDGLGKDHPLRDAATEICDAGERAAALTRQLLAFSRRQVIDPKLMNLNVVVGNLVKMLRRLVGEDIEVITALDSSLEQVVADQGQIEQVLMNLATNARDAMPKGGTLLIETKNVDIDEDYAAAHAEAKLGRHVVLTFSDSGVGMDEATRARAFEPFFTTKPRGMGTGIGLATVHGIVKQSNGWIWVYSEVGKGTTFKIYLPPKLEFGPVNDDPPAHALDLRGTETILVVEDQSEVRKLTVEALKLYGYRVMDAANGDDALQVCRSMPAPIDLMITDIVMPGMTGPEVAGQVAALSPGTKVLYISGYPQDLIAHQGVLDPGVAYLSKPFTAAALAEKVRDMLNKPRA